MHIKAEKKANLGAESAAEDWHPADVISALHKAGWTLKALGLEHGLSGGSGLSKALTSSFPLGEQRIADALGVHPKTLWPSRYYENGDIKPRGFRGIKFKRYDAGVNGKDMRVNRNESA